MKLTNIACIASVLLVSLSGATAASTLTAWTFDNLAPAPNGSPQPSTGFGTASALGLGNSYNNTNSLSNPDIQSLAGSSAGGANSWRIRGKGAAPNGGNGWSTNAPIGTQGAQFSGSTFGYYKVQVSFDAYATADAEANLQVQYTTDGIRWNNATITSIGNVGVITNNADPGQATVLGSYVKLASGWNTNITVDLSGLSGVDNNANFAVRLVNASTDTNCVDTTGAVYNNTSGSWTFDNVVIQGVSIDTITAWTFDSYGTTGFVPHPIPELGSGTATSIGFDTSYTFSDGSVGSTNKPDTLAQAGSSTPNATICWRVRGFGDQTSGTHNGWISQSPIGSQGAQFDVSTFNYNDVVVSFDLYFTSQAEAKMCVLYTTDAWATTNVASKLFYAPNPTFIQTNSTSTDTVMGTYFYQTNGQSFYNNLIVDFTGVPGVANNPNFGFRVVNAAQGNDCKAFNGLHYNDSSGNARFDNVVVGGTSGTPAPTLAHDPNATVDAPFTVTFTEQDSTWRNKIAGVYVNGTALTNSAYATNTANMIVFTPSKSALLQSSGVKNITIISVGFGTAKVTQPLAAGVATKLVLTQPAAPSASGGTLVTNPVVSITDQYSNGTTNPYSNVTVTATVGGAGGWTLGGSTVQTATNGLAVFTNLSATVNGSSAVAGAVITFTVTGYTNTANASTTTNFNSSSFTIGAPATAFTRGNLAVLQIDSLGNNTTFSVIEIKPSAARQTNAVNIIPISATGTNALRLNPAGSCGRLSLSDDGTLISFVGFADDSSATTDETFVQNRAVGTLDYTNKFSKPFSYTSISFGGSQGRSCCTLDNSNWVVADKGGLYVNDYIWSVQNNVVVRAFGGTAYIESQKTPANVVTGFIPNFGDPASSQLILPNNLAVDPVAVDFYMISTNSGASYDILYVLDQNSATSGLIKKYSLANDGSGNWLGNGSFALGNGGDSLFATTNGNGGVYLYYTTGGGGTSGNSVVRLTDAAGYNAPISIISSNVIYTAAAGTSLKGLTFVPQQVAYSNELIPPPMLTAQNGASVSSQFSVTNTPDDPSWRSAITGITVNGSLLPTTAYITNQAGKLIFDPTQSTLLQSSGTITIVISATGYSTNSIAQTLAAGTATKLVITTQPTAPAADGGRLATQPVVAIQDQFGNTTTSTATIAAAPVQGTWTLGGTTSKTAVAGSATFTDLTAFGNNAVAGATIHFTSTGLTAVDSTPGFNLVAPVQVNLSGAALVGGKLKFSFTNPTGLSFSVLATNALTTPKSTWPVVGQAIESPAGSGNYQFTNSAAAGAQQYYILRQP